MRCSPRVSALLRDPRLLRLQNRLFGGLFVGAGAMLAASEPLSRPGSRPAMGDGANGGAAIAACVAPTRTLRRPRAPAGAAASRDPRALETRRRRSRETDPVRARVPRGAFCSVARLARIMRTAGRRAVSLRQCVGIQRAAHDRAAFAADALDQARIGDVPMNTAGTFSAASWRIRPATPLAVGSRVVRHADGRQEADVVGARKVPEGRANSPPLRRSAGSAAKAARISASSACNSPS